MSGERPDPERVAAPQGPAETEIDPAIEPVTPDPTDPPASQAQARSATTGLLGSSAVMATGTVISRVTGVARDIALTAALGFYLVSDAYSLGNTMPNVLYLLVIGGALNAVFIPQLVRRMKDDADGGQAGGLDLQHGDIGQRIGADDLRLELAAVVEAHDHLVGAQAQQIVTLLSRFGRRDHLDPQCFAHLHERGARAMAGVSDQYRLPRFDPRELDIREVGDQ